MDTETRTPQAPLRAAEWEDLAVVDSCTAGRSWTMFRHFTQPASAPHTPANPPQHFCAHCRTAALPTNSIAIDDDYLHFRCLRTTSATRDDPLTITTTILPKAEGKGRAFSATLIAMVEADALWPGGQTKTDDHRPVLAIFAGSDTELRPFITNLRLGNKAQLGESKHHRRQTQLLLLKTAGYQFSWQRASAGTLVTAYLPDLFLIDPGMIDPAGARFIVLPSATWAIAQNLNNEAAIVAHAWRYHTLSSGYTPNTHLSVRDLVNLVPLAFLFCTYLDRRTRCPLLADGRFYLQLLLAFLTSGHASFHAAHDYGSASFGRNRCLAYREHATRSAGFFPGVAFQATHDEIETVLATEVARFFALTVRNVDRNRRQERCDEPV